MNTGIIPAFDQIVANEHPLHGNLPLIFTGTSVPDGDASPWKDVVVGSTYIMRWNSGASWASGVWVKGGNTSTDADWRAVSGSLMAYVSVADFTDGGSTVGTLTLPFGVPAGATYIGSTVAAVTGFAGSSTATLQVGDGTDADRYSTGTPSVYTTAAGVNMGAVSGTAYHAAAVANVVLTVTVGSDFTSAITNGAGRLLVTCVYR